MTPRMKARVDNLSLSIVGFGVAAGFTHDTLNPPTEWYWLMALVVMIIVALEEITWRLVP